MKPIMLHGHERSITQIRYNREGDLLFSSAKDSEPNVWYALNGERLGSFKGHTGAVWSIDVTWDTRLVLTGAADNSCKLWDCETGKCLDTITTQTAVRSCNFSFGGNLVLFTTDKSMGYPCEIFMYDIRDGNQLSNKQPAMRIPLGPQDSKISCSLWGALDEFIVTGHEDGSLTQWDVKAADRVHVKKDAHKKLINDMQASKDLGMIITASKDTTAKLFDAGTLNHLKTYKTDRPVNSAAVSPTRDHVLVGGGQEAMDVTTTAGKTGKFDAKFYHLVFEEEFARVKGHFGPINSVAFHPSGEGYSSGGEDGYVRVHRFDPAYFQFEFEY